MFAQTRLHKTFVLLPERFYCRVRSVRRAVLYRTRASPYVLGMPDSNAALTRRRASLANNMDLAWNASSAAAGALMLGARARTDILALLRPPQLR